MFFISFSLTGDHAPGRCTVNSFRPISRTLDFDPRNSSAISAASVCFGIFVSDDRNISLLRQQIAFHKLLCVVETCVSIRMTTVYELHCVRQQLDGINRVCVPRAIGLHCFRH